MKNIKLWLIALLILIIGPVLIYLTASQFLIKGLSEEIVLGFQEISEIPETDYSRPDFELADIKGERIKLGAHQNKIIIIAFWTTWNPASQDQIVILESYYQEIKDKEDIVLLTINNQEDKTVVSNFISRGEYVLPVLLDQDGEIGELYKINILPTTFFINKEGRVKETYIGILNKEQIKNKVEKLYAEQ